MNENSEEKEREMCNCEIKKMTWEKETKKERKKEGKFAEKESIKQEANKKERKKGKVNEWMNENI